jgi:hypothetical protein
MQPLIGADIVSCERNVAAHPTSSKLSKAAKKLHILFADSGSTHASMCALRKAPRHRRGRRVRCGKQAAPGEPRDDGVCGLVGPLGGRVRHKPVRDLDVAVRAPAPAAGVTAGARAGPQEGSRRRGRGNRRGRAQYRGHQVRAGCCLRRVRTRDAAGRVERRAAGTRTHPSSSRCRSSQLQGLWRRSVPASSAPRRSSRARQAGSSEGRQSTSATCAPCCEGWGRQAFGG